MAATNDNSANEKIDFKYLNKNVCLNLISGTGNVSKKIRKKRFYEKKFLDYIKKQAIEGTYIDVGANIGNHSIYFGLFTKAKNIISLEPHMKVYKVLKNNIKDNGLESKIKAHNVAIGDKVGRCSLVIDPSDEVGGSRIVKGNDIKQWKLDKFADEPITLIKIDVEGYEKFVIKGARKILKAHHPELFIELTSKQHYNEVFSFLKKVGYKPIGVFNNSATYHFSAKKKPGIFYSLTKHYAIRRILYYS